MNKIVRVGTRGSHLALEQTRIVTNLLKQQHPYLQFEQVIIKTRGDAVLDVSLSKIGDKGLFVKEIEWALLEKKIDIAVHSMKDLPTESPDELIIAAIPVREDARDVLISKGDQKLEELAQGAVIATSSLRRIAQLLAFRPDFRKVDIRGNVETRLRKFQRDSMDGIILAMAGLKRLGLQGRVSQILPFDIMLPAIAQGALGVQVRRDDAEILDVVAGINDKPSFAAVVAERAFLRTLGGGCQTPIAACAEVKDNKLTLKGKILTLDGSKSISGCVTEHTDNADLAGRKLAEELLELGAIKILEEIRAQNQ